MWDVIYAPFGGVSYIWSNPANIDLRFPGQWFQLESGLAYNWHRHYDATLGRYVQPDPLGLTAMLSDGPNVYSYAKSSPVNFKDPTGQIVVPFSPFAITGPSRDKCDTSGPFLTPIHTPRTGEPWMCKMVSTSTLRCYDGNGNADYDIDIPGSHYPMEWHPWEGGRRKKAIPF